MRKTKILLYACYILSLVTSCECRNLDKEKKDNSMTYQATGKVIGSEYNRLRITINSTASQPHTDQHREWTIESVEWPNGLEGEVEKMPLKIGENNLAFSLSEDAIFQPSSTPQLVVTIVGDGNDRTKVFIDLKDALAYHFFKESTQKSQEGKELLEKIDKALCMPIDKKKHNLELLLQEAENLLADMEKEQATIDDQISHIKNQQDGPHLSTAAERELRKLQKQAIIDKHILKELKSKVERMKVQILVLDKGAESATEALFNALDEEDLEAVETLLHDPELELGMIASKGTSLLRKAMEKENKTAIETLTKRGADPKLPDKFGAAKWRKYYGEVGEEPPIPEHIYKLLNQPCRLFPGKKVYETHLLTLMPATVDGEPLTLNSFKRMIENPKGRGHRTTYRDYHEAVKKELGEERSGPSYWVLMTRSVIPSSRNKTDADQRQLVQCIARDLSIEYTLPTILEGLVSVLCCHVETGTVLFGEDMPLSRCETKILRGYPIDFGYFNRYGPGIIIGSIGGDSRYNTLGVAAIVR